MTEQYWDQQRGGGGRSERRPEHRRERERGWGSETYEDEPRRTRGDGEDWDERGGRIGQRGENRGGYESREAGQWSSREMSDEPWGPREERLEPRRPSARRGGEYRGSSMGTPYGRPWGVGGSGGSYDYVGRGSFGGTQYDEATMSGERSDGYGAYVGYGVDGAGRERGEHSGKGPKGYKRSDDRIREDVCESLQRHPSIDASECEVSVQDGEVTLSGTVSDRRSKRLAEDCCEDVPGVVDVNNRLKVDRREGREQGEKRSTAKEQERGSTTQSKPRT